MKKYAVINLMQTKTGMPSVKIDAEQCFMDLEPLERATLLHAAAQLCGIAIGAIIQDNPDDEDEIIERLEIMELDAQREVAN